MSKPVERRPMSAYEVEAVRCLGQVRYPPCSWDKRFARHMGEMLHFGTITDKEAPQVWRLFVRYRRQIQHPYKADLLRMAGERSAPDLRKQEAARRAQDRIDQERQKYDEAMRLRPT